MCTLTFNESCPVCGRRLMVPIELLGLEVQCSHCRGSFRAQEEQEEAPSSWRDDGLRFSLEQRADELLSRYQSTVSAR